VTIARATPAAALDLPPRRATVADAPLLAEMNRQLIEDEGHRNAMSLLQLAERMTGWLEGEYVAILFERDGLPLAYVLYRDEGDAIYVRHVFVRREHRRSGIGRAAMQMVLDGLRSPCRVRLEVLATNRRGLAFWQAMGFREYAITLEREGGERLSEAVPAPPCLSEAPSA
jgi:ribosomal protein S18 acetylase RimI-like enzyme